MVVEPSYSYLFHHLFAVIHGRGIINITYPRPDNSFQTRI